MKILVVNSGSSSIKFRVFEGESEADLKEIAGGIVERIGEEISHIKYRSARGSISYDQVVADHEEGFRHIVKVLFDENKGVISDVDEIAGVGHRVVHGGDKIWTPTVVDEEVEKIIEEFSRMAPLHNPANLMGIRAAKKLFPKALHVAVFDTAFHQTLPEEAYLYAIPYEYFRKYRVRRYGFHGTSHMYVARRAAGILGRPLEELKIITCHLGNGASITAVKHGRSVETSMGLTPLEGLVMGTRSGDIDPSIIYFLMEWEGLSIDEVYDILNRRSGLLGLSEISNDMRIIIDRAAKGDPGALRALKVYVHRLKKYIGAYIAVMNGVDAIVFTAGVGEGSPVVRKMVLDNMEFLGVKIDEERNNSPWKYRGLISADDSRVKVLVVKTNEELVIAAETLRKIIEHRSRQVSA